MKTRRPSTKPISMKKRLFQNPTPNWFNERRIGSWFVIAAAALALTAPSAFGLSDLVSRIPNGSIFSCGTCHTISFGWNAFGQDFKQNNQVWNAWLASLDSDGDGLTNGQELGDPDGDGTPTPGAWVSNPGDPSSSAVPPRPPCTIIKSFGVLSKVTGLNPEAPLVQGPDGTLYGTARTGDGYGTVFKLQPDGTGFAVLKCFTDSVEGAYPCAGLVLSDGTLYGTTYGTARYVGGSGKGTVFKVNTDGTGFTVLKSFTGNEGANPSAGLVLSDGTLYGTTENGGSSGIGTVFKVNTDGTGHTVLKHFTSASEGISPWAGLVLSGGTLYGTTYGGSVFKVNTNGTGYTVLKNLTGMPRAGLVLSGSTLYGTTESGGSSGLGMVFKVNTDGTGYSVLKSFTRSDAVLPYAGLVLSGGMLYGTTGGGGSSNAGTVFKVNTDGTGYTTLKNFTGSDGSSPQARLVLSGSTLYGTASETVFKMNTNGTGYTVLKNLTGSSYAGLVLSGSTLYGTTYSGGSSGYGMVFKLNTNGTGYTALKNFTGSDGAGPYAGLVLSGATLYGTTGSGGSSDCGTVFKVDTDGTGFGVLKHFTGSNGKYPWAGLVLSGGTLYGTTKYGGSSDYGTLFKVNTDGTGFTVLKSFIGSPDGWGPSDLVLSGDTLYGTTKMGGTLNNGAVFRIDLSGGMTPVIDSQPQSQVNTVGTTTSFSVTAIGTAPLTCQWRKDGVDLADGVQSSGATISGATTTDLTIANVQMSDAGDYTVVVTNPYGSINSSVAALTVELPTPAILTANGRGSFISNGVQIQSQRDGGANGRDGSFDEPDILDATSDQFTHYERAISTSFNDPDSTHVAQRFYQAGLVSPDGQLVVELPRVTVRYAGFDEAYAVALGRILQEALEVYEAHGFEMPQKASLDAQIDPKGTQLWTDGASHIFLHLKSEALLAPASRTGVFNLYGMCHELGHIAMYRSLASLLGLPQGVAQGWADYAGKVVVTEVASRLGKSIWPEYYDVAEVEGIGRLKRDAAQAKPWDELEPSLRACLVFYRIETEYGRDTLAAAMTAALAERPTGNALMPLMFDKLRAATGNPAAADWAPRSVLEPPQVEWQTEERYPGDDFFADQKAEKNATGFWLRYDTGVMSGKLSISGAAQTVLFRTPEGSWELDGLKLFSARYGTLEPPKEDISIYICDESFNLLHEVKAPYSSFELGEEKWQSVSFPPVEVPKTFYLGVDFHATFNKGVYVGMDKTVKRSHSRLAMPYERVSDMNTRADWMLRPHLVPPK